MTNAVVIDFTVGFSAFGCENVNEIDTFLVCQRRRPIRYYDVLPELKFWVDQRIYE